MSINKNVSRRDFLKAAGLTTAGGFMLAACGQSGGKTDAQFVGGNIEFGKETDVVIIGAGGAGLWASYMLAKAGVSHLVVDKSISWGGDTILACGVLPVHGTIVQKNQGIEDLSPEETWEAYKSYYEGQRVPELTKMVYLNAPKCIDILTEEFGITWMDMKNSGSQPYLHIPAPGMQNDHKLLEPLYEHNRSHGGEYLFETRAVDLILDSNMELAGVRLRDEVTGEFTDVKAKKILLTTGDWVSNQEMIAKYMPAWTNTAVSTYGSMGEGIQLAETVGADLTNMDKPTNLMSNFAPTVVWGYYNSIVNVYPDGKRISNENKIFDAPTMAHANDFTFWWTIADSTLPDGYHTTSFKTREKKGDLVYADTISELAEKIMVPAATLEATIEKYNADAEAGEDTEFGKKLGFYPMKAPYIAIKNQVVRYKTDGGLKINEFCQVVDKAEDPIPNLYAAGSCTGETTPNVHDVFAIGMHAGEMIAKELSA